jgi:hypothetical protein
VCFHNVVTIKPTKLFGIIGIERHFGCKLSVIRRIIGIDRLFGCKVSVIRWITGMTGNDGNTALSSFKSIVCLGAFAAIPLIIQIVQPHIS